MGFAQLIIRKSLIGESERIRPLLDQLGYPLSPRDLKDRLQVYINSNCYSAFVAEIDKAIVGFIALSITELLLQPGRRCHVEALIVDNQHRKLGIGRALMAAVETYAREHGCTLVDLTSGVRRAKDGSHDFYRRLGYSDTGDMAKLHFRKELKH